ncbi:hypothetical protein ACI3E1_07190 [Ligilactobacillus sp. LYQ139]|uniref:hypothetical protein n=1 Tax=Ligilactobacillus sp. LYQ139 TaxID=3378800 RepID=UPI003852CEE5
MIKSIKNLMLIGAVVMPLIGNSANASSVSQTQPIYVEQPSKAQIEKQCAKDDMELLKKHQMVTMLVN